MRELSGSIKAWRGPDGEIVVGPDPSHFIENEDLKAEADNGKMVRLEE